VLVLIHDGGFQSGSECIQLEARISQSGKFYHRTITQAEASSSRQAQQIHALGGDILAHLAAGYIISCRAELLVEFGMDQMHLPQVGLAWITRHSGKVLYGLARVCVPPPPRPGRSVMQAWFCLLKACSPLRLTAFTRPGAGLGAPSGRSIHDILSTAILTRNDNPAKREESWNRSRFRRACFPGRLSPP
jgi:hypothetical protein